jgi:hypothetical protein
MKKVFLIFFALIFLRSVYSQDSVPKFFNQIQIVINHSAIYNDNTQNKFGLNLEAGHVFLLDRPITPILSIGYSWVNQRLFGTTFSSLERSYDINVQIHELHIPLKMRFLLNRFSVDIGGFFAFSNIFRVIGWRYYQPVYTKPTPSNPVPDNSLKYYEFDGVYKNVGANYGFSAQLGHKLSFFQKSIFLTIGYRRGFRSFSIADQVYAHNSYSFFGVNIDI